MPKVAIIEKCPSNNRYSEYFDFEFELFQMSSVKIPKLLKKDVDLEFNSEVYDFVILVGSEAAKMYAKVTSVTEYSGHLVDNKYICITNPAMLHFKPEGKPLFDKAVDKIKGYISGRLSDIVVSGDFQIISDTEEAVQYLKTSYSKSHIFALDTETTALYPRDGYVLGISISHTEKQGVYILSDCVDEEVVTLIQNIIETKEVVLHNSKFDIKMLQYHFGLDFTKAKQVHDTLAEHYVLDETEGSHGLKLLAMKYTNYGDYDSKLDEFKTEYCKSHGLLKENFTYDLIPLEIIGTYACIDTAVTIELHNKFYPLIQKHDKLSYVYHNLMMPGLLFLAEVEENGIPLDIDRLKFAQTLMTERIEEATERLYTYPDVLRFEEVQQAKFNPNSVQQLRKLLFDFLGLMPTDKKTATGAISTDAEVLGELAEQHEIPKLILDIRQKSKIKNTYLDKIIPELDRDNRIRTNFNLTSTTSGRLSSSGKFNAQQIIRDDPIIKGCIKARKGYKIVSQDLRTAEVYFAAILSGDKNLQKVFISGGDFHSSIAHMVFKLPCKVEEVKKLFPTHRQAAKAVTFSILYGAGAKKVAITVSKGSDEPFTLEDANDAIKKYFAAFPKLKEWLNNRKDFIAANGYTYSFFGRKRRLKNAFSTDKGIAAHAIRSGINFEIQAVASDVNLFAAIETNSDIHKYGLDAKIFMLVHDSIVAEVRDEDVEQYCKLLAENTQKNRGVSINNFPIGIDVDIGEDYSFNHFEEVYGDLLDEYLGSNISSISSL